MLKKIIYTLLSALLLMTFVVSHASAAEGKTTIKVGEITAEANSTVDIPISLSNNTGLCGMTLNISYNSELVLKGVTKGSALSELYMTKPGDLTANPVNLLWDGMEEDKTNGDIAVLSFACPNKTGTYEIIISADVIDGDLNPVDIETINGSIAVTDVSPHEHSGGIATCVKKAVCDICGAEYGELDPSNHQNIEIINEKEPTYTEEGYTGDTYCKDCETVIKAGEVIPVLKDGPIIRVQNQSVFTGNDIVVPVIMENNPGFAGFSFDINYDKSVMSLVSVSEGPILLNGTIDTNGDTVNWYTSDNIKNDGVILNITFKILEKVDVSNSEVSITLHDGKPNLVNEEGKYLEMNYFPGNIEIKEGIIGDVTGDYDITIGDVVVLNRSILKKAELSDKLLPFADVNGDRIISIGDVVVLNRHVLGKETIEEARAYLEIMGDDLGAPGDSPIIIIDAASIKPEDTIDIPVRIEENPGIAGMAIDFVIPEGFELVSIDKGELLSEGTFTASDNSFSWYSTDNITENGVLVTLKVKAGKDAQNGVIGIKVKDDEQRNIVDNHSLTVLAEFVDGLISIRTATDCEINGHVIGDAVHENEKPATCSREGSYDEVQYCTICGEEVSRKTIIDPIKAHSWNEGVVTKEATQDNDGERLFTCTVCGKTKTEVIPSKTKEENQKAAATVTEAINKMDPSDPTSVEAAKKAYDALTEEQKKLIDPAIVEQLEKAVKENEKIPVTSIKITGISNKIAAGKKVQLTATVLPKNAKNKTLKWTSNNTKVAKVSQTGLVSIAKKTGGKTVKITAAATDGSGKKAVFTIKVMKGAVTKVTIKGAKKTLKVGKTMKLRAVVKKSKGTANKKIKWTSSNPEYATVSSSGKVKALKAGKGKKVKITAMATDGSGKKKVVTIKIK